MKYRVILYIGYREAYYEFDSAEEATKFAEIALTHSVASEDTNKASKIILEFIDQSNIDEEEDD